MEISVTEVVNLLFIIGAVAIGWTVLSLVFKLARFVLGLGCGVIVLIGLIALFAAYL